MLKTLVLVISLLLFAPVATEAKTLTQNQAKQALSQYKEVSNLSSKKLKANKSVVSRIKNQAQCLSSVVNSNYDSDPDIFMNQAYHTLSWLQHWAMHQQGSLLNKKNQLEVKAKINSLAKKAATSDLKRAWLGQVRFTKIVGSAKIRLTSPCQFYRNWQEDNYGNAYFKNNNPFSKSQPLRAFEKKLDPIYEETFPAALKIYTALENNFSDELAAMELLRFQLPVATGYAHELLKKSFRPICRQSEFFGYIGQTRKDC